MDMTGFLSLPTWRAFDVDDEGRVLAGSDASGTVQLVEIGADAATRELTALPGACVGRYLPGARQVVVSRDVDGNERAQLSLLDLDTTALPATVDGLTEIVHDERHIHDLCEVLDGRVVYRTNRGNGVDFDVLVRDVLTGAEETLYDGGGLAGGATVSSDGRHVALTRPATTAMSDQLLLVDATAELPGDHLVELTDLDAPGQISRLAWLGDTHRLVVCTDRDREHVGVAQYDVDAGRWSWLVTDDTADLAAWPAPDGRTLLVIANRDGLADLSLHDHTGAHLRALTLPTRGWSGFSVGDPVWSADSRYVAVTTSSAAVPGDVVRIDVSTGEPTVVASSTDALASVAVSQPRVHRTPGEGGDIPSYVYDPTVVVPELSGAAVLVIHGGPESQSWRRFSPVVQGLTSAGLTVVVPNVRGSTGYGRRWYSADDIGRRGNSIDDLAALHADLARLGLDRAALWGGSYGGYMVLAGVAFQPQLWSAGVDIVGMSSLVTFLENTSPYRRAQREREYGSLESDREFLESISPLNAIDDIVAPLFVVHGANDPRVPLSEAEQLRDALGDRNVPCELVVYGDEGHGLARRSNRLDAYPRALDFLCRQLRR